MSTQAHKVRSDGYHTPDALKESDVWVVWSPELGKTARAPWQEGHMYPAEWAESKDVDPRTTYNQASATASLPIEELDTRYPFPNDADPETVLPTILIPPKEQNADRWLFVDFDDVVTPDGTVTPEVWDIIESLGGYAEISRSGNGLHVWVRADLPDGIGKFIEPLDGIGQLEMYDRGRMTGCTWRHVEGTPKEAVPEAQDTVNSLVERYATDECAECGATVRAKKLDGDDPDCPECGEPFNGDSDHEITRNETRADNHWSRDNKENPYYQLDVTDVADTGAFSSHRENWQGPHPKHGGTSQADGESINFNVDPSGGVWHCFAHDSGGGALSLIAVLEGIVSCRNAHKVHRNRDTLLQACIAAREHYASDLDGETPPYNALLAVAAHAGLETKGDETLGTVAHKFAENIYHEIGGYEQLTDPQPQD